MLRVRSRTWKLLPWKTTAPSGVETELTVKSGLAPSPARVPASASAEGHEGDDERPRESLEAHVGELPGHPGAKLELLS